MKALNKCKKSLSCSRHFSGTSAVVRFFSTSRNASYETEACLSCYSSKPDAKEQAITNRFIEKFATSLRKLADGLTKPCTDPRGAYVAAVLMRDGAKDLEPYMHGASTEERAALLVTYYKQGFDTMKRLYDDRVKRTKDASYMKPGEGAVIFHQMPAIRSILEHGGKGNRS